MGVISVIGLEKSYGDIFALRGVDLDVGAGEIFGVIGPDGAGKSTLLRILATLLLPDAGSARIRGLDVVSDYELIRRDVGYMPGRFSLYSDLSVEENLRFFATLFSTTVEENYHLVSDIYRQLEPFSKRRAAALSGGMKQKLALCCALIHAPSLLILDEPTTGVDPVSRREFWDMLGRLRERGITILVSTPYMDEAGRCDRVALMREGRFIGIDTPAGLVSGFGRRLWTVRGSDMFALLSDLRANPAIDTCFAFGDVHHVTLRDEEYTKRMLEEYLRHKGHAGVSVDDTPPTVEDYYLDRGRAEA